MFRALLVLLLEEAAVNPAFKLELLTWVMRIGPELCWVKTLPPHPNNSGCNVEQGEQLLQVSACIAKLQTHLHWLAPVLQ